MFGPAPRGVAYDEYDRYNSGNPYAAAKVCSNFVFDSSGRFFVQAGGEEFAVAYENTYKMPIVVTHTMNVFGERQNPEKFIPGVVSAVREGKQVRTLMVRMTMIVLNQITIHSDTTRTIPGLQALHPCEGRGGRVDVHPLLTQGLQAQRCEMQE